MKTTNYLVFLFLLVFLFTTAYPQVNLDSGLVAWYPLNGTPNDSSGYGKHGVIYGGVTFGTDRFNYSNFCYVGNGASCIDIPVHNFPIGNNARSTCIWYKCILPFPGGLRCMFGWGNNIFGERWAYHCDGSTLGLEWVNGSITIPYPQDSNWHFLVFTYPENGLGTQSVKIYLDGVLQSTTIWNPVNSYNTASGPAHHIGELGLSNYLYCWVGKLDDIRVYNRELTQSEITALYYKDTSLFIGPTGGTISVYKGNGINGIAGVTYRVHTFTTSGIFSSNGDLSVDILVVGGGARGGFGSGGGGGGGGGVIYVSSYLVTNSPKIVIIGEGGTGTHYNGENSVFADLIAYGGGTACQNGGCGGGQGMGISDPVGQGYVGQGYNGGLKFGSQAAGGGGAGEVGGNASYHTGGNGGNGFQSYISGVLKYYGGGGGGAPLFWYEGYFGGYGGAGGGGRGEGGNFGATSGEPNTGGGGGATGGSGSNPGNGGSGTVIIRYPVTPVNFPILNYPLNNSVNISLTPTIIWDTIPIATGYKIKISLDSTFTTIIDSETVASGQYSVPIGKLNNGTKYYWKVAGFTNYGIGPWSSTWNFRTFNLLSIPNLILPLNNSTDVSLTPTLVWDTIYEATGYKIKISTDSTFIVIVDSNNISLSQYTVPSGKLSFGKRYYWKVAGYNEYTIGQWSNVWNFLTSQNLTLNLKVYLEGFWNGTTQIPDTVKVYLANSTAPFEYADSSEASLSTNGTGTFNFSKCTNGNYYIIVTHRNHLETWSRLTKSFTTNVPVSYDFTTSYLQAYGYNMAYSYGKWCLYGGDINQDGFVDGTDMAFLDNDLFNYASGYVVTDVNGDQFVDGADMAILDNNLYNYIGVVRPSGKDANQRSIILKPQQKQNKTIWNIKENSNNKIINHK